MYILYIYNYNCPYAPNIDPLHQILPLCTKYCPYAPNIDPMHQILPPFAASLRLTLGILFCDLIDRAQSVTIFSTQGRR